MTAEERVENYGFDVADTLQKIKAWGEKRGDEQCMAAGSSVWAKAGTGPFMVNLRYRRPVLMEKGFRLVGLDEDFDRHDGLESTEDGLNWYPASECSVQNVTIRNYLHYYPRVIAIRRRIEIPDSVGFEKLAGAPPWLKERMEKLAAMPPPTAQEVETQMKASATLIKKLDGGGDAENPDGIRGESSENPDYPFPEGHKRRMRRAMEWSVLANQVVGAEHIPETRSVSEIEDAFVVRLCEYLGKYGINTSDWDGDTDPAEIIASCVATMRADDKDRIEELEADSASKVLVLTAIKDMLEGDELDSLECKCYPVTEVGWCPRCSYITRHINLVLSALTKHNGDHFQEMLENACNALEKLSDAAKELHADRTLQAQASVSNALIDAKQALDAVRIKA